MTPTSTLDNEYINIKIINAPTNITKYFIKYKNTKSNAINIIDIDVADIEEPKPIIKRFEISKDYNPRKYLQAGEQYIFIVYGLLGDKTINRSDATPYPNN